MQFTKLLCGITNNAKTSIVRYLSCNTAAIVKVHRSIYARRYPTVMVLPNGATINLSYHEPRRIIKLPLDLSLLSEAERKARIEKRKPKQKIRIDDDVEDTFNANKYLKYMKK
ncbi:39S ribosomal protein L55, mitochondrial [Anopheles maculipalpis]|uniref:39S ribosomal protein L55, mitochondrial n=1 Tax=Anopheles maculipalpis TaxID=1496333 RepID=UPI0021590360|nr:39S ribosomal protein L55, mitochondrial [Anopheles maculipalpis]